MKDVATSFTRFVDIIRQLRDPETGCPWDLKQTHKTLRPYLLEETCEAIDAIDGGSDEELCQELGDVLLQIVLHAQIASERHAFGMNEISNAISDKMIRRHPHVFADVKVDGAADVVKNWEQIKQQERQGDNKPSSEVSETLQGIPRSLPSLLRAQRIGEKTAVVGFDWDSPAAIRAKVQEEIDELDVELEAIETEGLEDNEELRRKLEHELGDVLFTLAQLARKLGLSAEDALRIGCNRFEIRYTNMEQGLSKPLEALNLEEMEIEWQKAKARLKDHGNTEQ
jgi:MazG family protein